MEHPQRSVRRHHIDRLRRRVASYYFGWAERSQAPERVVGILVNTRTICSCSMCGNPRHKRSEAPFAELRLAGRRRRFRACRLFTEGAA